jgi:hypothetical protein
MAALTMRRAELAHRTSGGIDVYLFWEQRTNRVSVEVIDARTRDSFELDVDPQDALDAFNHPYAYAARLDTATPPQRQSTTTSPRRTVAAENEPARRQP